MDRSSGCIYCGSSGPFADEHVVPAGLGGDDSDWMLKGCVCAKCNTDVFSPLELELLRRSPIALARMFLQSSTRDRKRAPTFEPRTNLFHDSQSNLLLAAYAGPSGMMRVLPQVVCFTGEDGTRIGPTGTDVQSLKGMLSQLDAQLNDDVLLIHKTSPGAFEVHRIRWVGEAYTLDGSDRTRTPPKLGFWWEILDRSRSGPSEPLLPRCIYQRDTGQLVCRAANPTEAAKVMGVVRLSLPEVRALCGEGPTTHPDPEFRLQVVSDMGKVNRALVKIGLNLIAFAASTEMMRGAGFDDAVNFVLSGGAGSWVLPAPNPLTLGPAMPDHHYLALSCLDQWVLLTVQLYGGPALVAKLGCLDRKNDEFDRVIFHVNYEQHEIRRMSLEEHASLIACFFGGIAKCHDERLGEDA